MSRALLATALASMLAGAAARAAEGERLFNGSCALCHQRGGTGSPGLAPPLIDGALWDRLGSRAPSYLAGVMLAGLSGTIETLGVTYSGLIMPPQNAMSDEELAAIGTYVLSTLNDTRQALAASAVAELRTGPPSHARLRETRRTGA